MYKDVYQKSTSHAPLSITFSQPGQDSIKGSLSLKQEITYSKDIPTTSYAYLRAHPINYFAD